MLEVNGLSAGYQDNDVVHDVALRVDQGEAVMLLRSVKHNGRVVTLYSILGGSR